LMQHYVPWLIGNTELILGQAARGGPAPKGFDQMLGTMAGASEMFRTEALQRVRLKKPDEAPVVEVPYQGGQPPNGPARLLAELKVPGTPEFLVLEQRGKGDDAELRVSGANFNTYAAIRHLRTSRQQLNIGGRDGHTWTSVTPIRNTGAWVWIDAVLTEPVASAATPDAAGAQPAVPQPQPQPAEATQEVQPPPKPRPAELDLQLRRDPSGPADTLAPRRGSSIGPQQFGPPADLAAPGDTSRSVLPGIQVPF
jgi:hypothetical protein